MHIPKIFNQDDGALLKSVMCDYPFATVFTHSKTGLDAHHIPLLLNRVEGRDVLQGHIAKANPLWQNLPDMSDVLAVFSGPNCYISPNYYPTKKATAKAVPTWNYIAVHVNGVMRYIHDKPWNLTMIDNLTRQHEANQMQPWSTDDAPEGYIDKMLAAIVGLEIEIVSIKGQWKLSQNQPEINRQGVVEGLFKEDQAQSQKIATLVQSFSRRR